MFLHQNDASGVMDSIIWHQLVEGSPPPVQNLVGTVISYIMTQPFVLFTTSLENPAPIPMRAPGSSPHRPQGRLPQTMTRSARHTLSADQKLKYQFPKHDSDESNLYTDNRTNHEKMCSVLRSWHQILSLVQLWSGILWQPGICQPNLISNLASQQQKV